ncbi:hypothetical protein [Mycolicibacterium fortuitum]|uniref:hypothetical protein n=1 Tax=Mycolicibacterium fortuitum TaxID=1766 RepID=UPI00096F2C0E|nr:hypothetical protein [Mycolicibacterium fortuitum]OMC11149.1 hypothetical protein A5734_24340 [Mycolicibacterium fortuitum]
MPIVDKIPALAAHNSPFDRVAQCHHPRYAPMPQTYEEAVAELQVTREELEGVLAEHENFAPLLLDIAQAHSKLAGEFAELLTDRERIRAERDDLALRFEYVTDENAALLEEIAELRAAASPAEVVLADGGTAVLG